MNDVIIVGGGLAGLYSAYFLRQLPSVTKITVVEASNRFGGWIRSHKTKEGTTYELGPRTVRFNKRGWKTLDLIDTLGMRDRCIGFEANHTAASDRRIKVDGKLHKVPVGWKGILQKQEPFTEPIMKSIVRNIWQNELPGTDSSLHVFSERLAGPEVARYLVDPIARGIFAGSSKHLSIQALFRNANVSQIGTMSFLLDPVFRGISNYTYKIASSSAVEKAMHERWKIWTLEGGMESLIDELVIWLQKYNVHLMANSPCTDIHITKNHVKVNTTNGAIEGSSLVSALPSCHLSPLVTKIAGGKLSELLDQIPYVTVGMVNLEYDGNIITEPSFGYLIPSTEKCKALGVIYDSCIRPQGNKTVLTVMMGGHWFEQLFGPNPSKEQLFQEAVKEVSQTLGFKQSPTAYHVSIHRDCIPQYTVGHKQRVQDISECVRINQLPLVLVGNSYNGVGVNDVIHSAAEALEVFEPLQ